MRTFPEVIDFYIPGFEKSYPLGSTKTLALQDRDCREWFHECVDQVISSCGVRFLPICRMSDGEFLFILGEQAVDIRLSLAEKIRQRLSRIKHHIVLKGGVGPFTAGHYHSGHFSAAEWHSARTEVPTLIKAISEKGILAWHLNFTAVPFHERYFPALEKWIVRHKVLVTTANYYPFYFIYALLTGPRRSELLKGRRVLVINGAEGEKQRKITDGLLNEGVAEVLWCKISLKRSYFETIDITPFIGRVDLALVGAGIGKLKLFQHLEPLGVPCIDAGFVFEVWADPNNRFKRVYCASDANWEELGSSPQLAGI